MSELVLEKNQRLPNTWIVTNIGTISTKIHYGYTETATTNNTGTKFLRITDIQNNTVNWESVPYCKISNEEKQNYLLHENDLVFARTGGTVGKSFLIKNDVLEAVFASYLIRIILSKLIMPKYVYYFFKTSEYWKQIQLKKTGLKTNVNAQILSKIIFPLAPLNEQKRIVSKIEELFSHIDSTFQLFEKIRAQLKHYKNSLLKSAYLGELTEDFRKDNPAESVEPLLAKIKQHKNKQDKKLQRITFEDIEKQSYQIPTSWKWIRIGNICERLQYGTSEKANGDSDGIPVLRMGNIIDGKLSFNDLKFFPQNWENKSEFLLESNDTLFNRTNSAELVGKTAIYEENYPPAVFASYLIRIKVFSDVFLPKLLPYYINSFFGRIFIKSVVSQQVGQANVNGTKLSMMIIPLIPLNEQHILLEKIETGISTVNNINFEISTRLQNLGTLKRIILQQAFDGKLVPQDPNDEPAEILLQKIKQEKKKQ